MAPGRFSVPMKLQVWQTCGVMNLRVYLSSMRKRCNLSLSQTDVSCQDISNFLDLNAPIQRYLTLLHCPQGKAKKVVQAQKLWFAILEAQIETGNPYMLFKVCIMISELLEYYAQLVVCNDNSQVKHELKTVLQGITTSFDFANCILQFQDACNRKSNQQNLGTIKSSNLCTEIVEFTSPNETAVCNLASLALPRFVREKVRPYE